MKKFIANTLTIIAFAVVIGGIVALAIGIIQNL
jgi:ABC-type arginine/histidine transport system permease subunit